MNLCPLALGDWHTHLNLDWLLLSLGFNLNLLLFLFFYFANLFGLDLSLYFFQN